jgi:class 3 adenylate cyclase
MFTDIKGFTARTSKSTREDLVELLRKHEEIVLPRAAERHGTLIKNIGDAFLFTFESPTNAVLAALDIQRGLREYNASVEPGKRIEVRIGINAGEVTVMEGDVYGDAVNIAARIEGIADGGEICFAESVFLTMNKNELEAAVSSDELRTDEIGFRALKGVAEKVRVYRIGPPGAPLPPVATFDESDDTGVAVLEPDRPVPQGHVRRDEDLAFSPDTDALVEKALRDGIESAARRTTEDGSTPAQRWFGYGMAMLLIPGAGVALAIVASALALHSVWLGAVGGLLLVACKPYHFSLVHRRMWFLRCVALLACLAFAWQMKPRILREAQLRENRLANTLRSGQLLQFGFDAKAAIALFNGVAAWSHGDRGYKEASVQRWQMFVDGPAERRWASELPMESDAVRKALAPFVGGLKHETRDEASMPSMKLTLDPGRETEKVWLTLPLATVSAKARRQHGGWTVNAWATVDLGEQSGVRVPVVYADGFVLTFDDRLTRVLQHDGWLLPFTAKWMWSFRADDSRMAGLLAERAEPGEEARAARPSQTGTAPSSDNGIDSESQLNQATTKRKTPRARKRSKRGRRGRRR